MEAERPLARGTAHPLWPLFVLALGADVLALVLAHPRLAPLEVKGKEEPVEAYLLRGLAGGS